MLVFVAIFALAGACFVQAQPKGGGAPLDLVGDLKANYTAGKTKILAAAESGFRRTAFSRCAAARASWDCAE